MDKQWITFNSQGKQLFGVLHIPSGVKKAPGVVICHGFGGNKCGKHRLYVHLANQLAAMGVVTLRFDFHSCGDSDGDWRDMSIEGEVADALTALDQLKALPYIDVSRIALVGRSLGGAIATLTAGQTSIKSLVLWSPVFGAFTWKEEWSRIGQKMGSQPPKDEPIWFNGEAANLTFIKQFFSIKMDESLLRLHATPLLHLHGNQDTEVPPIHAEHYEQCRKGANAPSRFIRLSHSDHDFSNPADRKILLDETIKWLQNTL